MGATTMAPRKKRDTANKESILDINISKDWLLLFYIC